jgi:hypothetical protein
MYVHMKTLMGLEPTVLWLLKWPQWLIITDIFFYFQYVPSLGDYVVMEQFCYKRVLSVYMGMYIGT